MAIHFALISDAEKLRILNDQDNPRHGGRRRSSWRTISLRGLLVVTTFVALFLALVVLPLENKRLAIQSLQERGILVWLSDDLNDPAGLSPGASSNPPGRLTRIMHELLPASYLQSVERVTFQGKTTPTEQDFTSISRLGEVDSLWINETSPHPQWLTHLIKSRNIQQIGISDCQETESLLEMVGQISSLTGIYIDRSPVTERGMKGLIRHPSLRNLRLQETGCTDEAFQQVGELRALHDLEITESNITELGTRKLSGLINLKTLRMNVQGLGDEAFGFLSSLTELEQLELTGTQITDETLAHLSHATRMHVLSVTDSKIDGTGLGSLGAMRELSSINLRNSKIQSGLNAVAVLPKLNFMELSDTLVDDEQIELLSHSESLEQLYLRGTKVTDQGLTQLAKIPSLNRLLLSGSKVTHEGVLRFKALRPKVDTD